MSNALIDANGMAARGVASLTLPARNIPYSFTIAPNALTREHIEAWDDLSDNASDPNSFFGAPMLLAAFAHLPLPPSLQCAIIADSNGQWLGMMPIVHHQRYYDRWPLPHIGNWLHPNSFAGTPLVRKGVEEAFWQAFLPLIDRQAQSLAFLHLDQMACNTNVFQALETVCKDQQRGFYIADSIDRAMLCHCDDPQAYYAQAMRKKKRKELRRQRNRLAELGRLSQEGVLAAELTQKERQLWFEAFLTLEKEGWKGRQDSALASQEHTAAFFHQACQNMAQSKKLHLAALRLDGQPIAMLLTFLDQPGGYSFKTCFDERYARFSPGLLLQIDNLDLPRTHGLEWIDSCADPDHPMIDSLWVDRRKIGRISIGLKGKANTVYFQASTAAKRLMQQLRERKRDA